MTLTSSLVCNSHVWPFDTFSCFFQPNERKTCPVLRAVSHEGPAICHPRGKTSARTVSRGPPAPADGVASQAAAGLPWHDPNREVRVSGWSRQMVGVMAATLNILFDFDSYFPSSSCTPETSPSLDSVPTASACGGCGGQRSWKQVLVFFFFSTHTTGGTIFS